MIETESETTNGRNISLYVAIASALLAGATGGAWWFLGGTLLQVAFLLSQVVVISIIIWQACDPFAEAAQWIGVKFHIPGSVRGATLDAPASSMPELFTGIFFVVVAMLAADETKTVAAAGSDGYGSAVATCAGSAVYNMMLIPAICALVISFSRKSRPTIDVAPKVILRDGMWFLGCELLLIFFLFQTSLSWWMGVVLVGLYVVYVCVLYADARRFRRAILAVREHLGKRLGQVTAEQISDALESNGMKPSRSLVTEVHARVLATDADPLEALEEEEEEADETAELAFGMFEVPLNGMTSWIIILISTLIAAGACYWLVHVTEETAQALGAPIFFVAVIVAAAASSVPDTFLSIGAARRGDDDGAVSNAFGSNIFDICICLAVPLFIACYLNGWQPISLTQNGKPMEGLVGLRLLLCGLTIVTLLIMWHNQQLTRRKALVLCALYGIFVLYAVAGSLGYSVDEFLSPGGAGT